MSWLVCEKKSFMQISYWLGLLGSQNWKWKWYLENRTLIWLNLIIVKSTEMFAGYSSNYGRKKKNTIFYDDGSLISSCVLPFDDSIIFNFMTRGLCFTLARCLMKPYVISCMEVNYRVWSLSPHNIKMNSISLGFFLRSHSVL